MKIESLHLVNYRGVRDRKVNFGPNLTIVEGENEAGKSSMMEALSFLRRHLHTSKRQDIKSAQPIGRDEGPEVTLVGSSGPYQFTYKKRWLKRPKAELTITAPKREDHTGTAAHDRFTQILEETLDVDLLDALQVLQGQSLDQPDLGNMRALRTALATKAETYVSDEASLDSEGHLDDLMEAIEKEWSQYYTTRGPKGELRELPAALEEAQASLSAIQQKTEELEVLTDQLEKGRAEQDRVRRILEEETEARQALVLATQKVRAAEDTVKDLTQSQELLQRDLDLAKRDRDDRVNIRKEAGDLSKQAKASAKSLKESRRQAEEASKRQEVAKGRLIEAEGQARKASMAYKNGVEALAVMKDSVELARLVGTKEHIVLALEEKTAAQASFDKIKVDSDTLDDLRNLQSRVDQAEAALRAATATITVENLGAETILLGEQTLKEGVSGEPVTELLTVEVPGEVRVTIAPPSTAKEYEQDLDESTRHLQSTLERVGAASLKDADHQLKVRTRAEADMEAADNRLVSLTSSMSASEVDERIALLSAKGTPDEPANRSDIEAAEEDLSRAQTEVEQKDRAQSDHEMAEKEASASLQEAQSKYATSAALHEQVTERLGSLEAALAEAQEKDEDIHRRYEAALVAATRGQEAVDEATDDLAKQDPEQTQADLENAESLVARYTKELSQVTEDTLKTKAILDRLLDQGLLGKETEAAAQVDAFSSRLERLEAKAAAAKLLYETLKKHKKAAQERYVAPLEQAITNLGARVFGSGFEVRVTPELRVESSTRGGPHVPFESLSAGTREQLGVLGRLATATLIQDEGAPLILDDTLGYSDPGRLATLGAVLSHVGKETQVVVLTCQPERYRSVGGAEVVKL